MTGRGDVFEFEGFRLDLRRMGVWKDRQHLPLEPKALDVLCHLVAHRDRLVTKDELLDAVWKDTFVTPNALTRAVAQLRKGLGDDVDHPRLIETVAKRGYRFVAPGIVNPNAHDAIAEAAIPPAPTPTLDSATARRRSRPVFAAGVMATIVLVVTASVILWIRKPAVPVARAPEIVALTSFGDVID